MAGWFILGSVEAEAPAQFEEMKDALTAILATIPLANDPQVDVKMQQVSEAMSLFVQQYP